jgi:predicted lipid-binding transport protein (Tim44 family)
MGRDILENVNGLGYWIRGFIAADDEMMHECDNLKSALQEAFQAWMESDDFDEIKELSVPEFVSAVREEWDRDGTGPSNM